MNSKRGDILSSTVGAKSRQDEDRATLDRGLARISDQQRRMSDCLFCQEERHKAEFQGVPFLTMALRMVNSFRMQAVRTTLKGLP